MPSKCSIVGCNGNYTKADKVSVFRFPKDEALQVKWLKFLNRKDFIITENSRICERHFRDDQFIKHSDRVELKPGSIPSTLEDVAVDSNNSSGRRNVFDKVLELDHQNFKLGVIESIKSHHEYQKENHFSSLPEFRVLIRNDYETFTLGGKYQIVDQENKILFLIIKSDPMPKIQNSLVISETLNVSVYGDGCEFKVIGVHRLPKVISSVDEILNLLKMFIDPNFKTSRANDLLKSHLDSAVDNLNKVRNLFIDDVDKQRLIEFVIHQLKLVCLHPTRYRYESDFMILCGMFYTISPHAYKFLRKSKSIIIPHPKTLGKVFGEFNSNPANESTDHNFLCYIRERMETITSEDKLVILLMDEIHLKPFLDYKGGKIVGAAYNSSQAAKSAYTFMIKSLRSTFKEVAHILPVLRINAEELHRFVRKIIITLHEIGFTVIAVVSDNNAINGKTMSLFSDPPELKTRYNHPFLDPKGTDPDAMPLFYLFDSVHILKCVRNNWLNNKPQCFNYPEFQQSGTQDVISTASFGDLKNIHSFESDKIVKYCRTLTLKTINPSSQERQNVKLAINVFNEHLVEGLKHYKKLQTADFIRIITEWWSVMNVKTMFKGIRFRNDLERPLTLDGKNFALLLSFLDWLDRWKNLKLQYLTPETGSAIYHTTKAMTELAQYCIQVYGWEYILPGKVQTDSLEERFGNYRTMAGCHYIITLRQVFEVENKLRIRNLLPVKHLLKSCKFGGFNIAGIENVIIEDDIENIFCFDSVVEEEAKSLNITYNATDLLSSDDFHELIPVFTYIGGFCLCGALRKVKCDSCSAFFMLKKDVENLQDERYSFVTGLDRGGLILPHFDVVLVVSIGYSIMQQLISKEREENFLKVINQKKLLIFLILEAVRNELDFAEELHCQQHHHQKMIELIAVKLSNIFINNYVKNKNDVSNVGVKGKNRKMKTLLVGKSSQEKTEDHSPPSVTKSSRKGKKLTITQPEKSEKTEKKSLSIPIEKSGEHEKISPIIPAEKFGVTEKISPIIPAEKFGVTEKISPIIPAEKFGVTEKKSPIIPAEKFGVTEKKSLFIPIEKSGEHEKISPIVPVEKFGMIEKISPIIPTEKFGVTEKKSLFIPTVKSGEHEKISPIVPVEKFGVIEKNSPFILIEKSSEHEEISPIVPAAKFGENGKKMSILPAKKSRKNGKNSSILPAKNSKINGKNSSILLAEKLRVNEKNTSILSAQKYIENKENTSIVPVKKQRVSYLCDIGNIPM